MTSGSIYDGITPESIKDEMLAALAVGGNDIDTREGSYSNTLVSVAAYQIYKLYQQMAALVYAAFPDEKAGEYIDKNAAQIGIKRIPGTKAAVNITVTGADGTVLPAGTALYAPESGLKYVTLAEALITEGATTVRAQAEHAGETYNLPAGSITSLYANVAGVNSVTNLSAASGGTDEESDAALFARYHRLRTLPVTSGNKNHYITWATETPGVAFASCLPLWNGNGTVKVVIAGADRGPVTENVRAACAEHIEASRPIGAIVTVVSVVNRALPLTASITLVSGHTTAQVEEQLRAAVLALLAAQPFGTEVSIPYSRFLACLLQCPGVADYSAFTVDGGIGAVTLQPEQTGCTGTIALTVTAG